MAILQKIAIFVEKSIDFSTIARRKGGRFLKGLKVPILAIFQACKPSTRPRTPKNGPKMTPKTLGQSDLIFGVIFG